MSTLARLTAVVALILWPAMALANVPPPEETPPTPAQAPADPAAPAAVDAPPAELPPAEATPVTDPSAPPAAIEDAASPNMGMIVGIIAFLAVAAGAGYWFVSRNRA